MDTLGVKVFDIKEILKDSVSFFKDVGVLP